MSLTASAILSAIAPQFDSYANRAEHIQLATQRTSSKCFGENYTYAIALRAAHTLTLTGTAVSTGSTGGVGGVTSMKEGDLSVSFGGSGSIGVSGDLGQTSYGIELQGLIKGSIYPVKVVNVSNCE